MGKIYNLISKINCGFGEDKYKQKKKNPENQRLKIVCFGFIHF